MEKEESYLTWILVVCDIRRNVKHQLNVPRKQREKFSEKKPHSKYGNA